MRPTCDSYGVVSLNSVLGTLEPGYYAMLRGRRINKVRNRCFCPLEKNLLVRFLKASLRIFIAGSVQ